MSNEIRTSAVTYWFKDAYQRPGRNRRPMKKRRDDEKGRCRQKTRASDLNDDQVKIDEYA